jgi:iron complex outermembrane receptor protein
MNGDFSTLDIISIINDYGKKMEQRKSVYRRIAFQFPANNTAALKWTAGAYFFHPNVPNKQATYFGADAGYYGIPILISLPLITSTGKNTGISSIWAGQFIHSIKNLN